MPALYCADAQLAPTDELERNSDDVELDTLEGRLLDLIELEGADDERTDDAVLELAPSQAPTNVHSCHWPA